MTNDRLPPRTKLWPGAAAHKAAMERAARDPEFQADLAAEERHEQRHELLRDRDLRHPLNSPFRRKPGFIEREERNNG